MAYKLYFKYGVMGSSKTAQALMTRFNYEQQGYKVLLMKPKIDNRDDKSEKTIIKSRIGLEEEAYAFSLNENLIDTFSKLSEDKNYNVIICDESQFCTAEQIEQFKTLTDKVPVFCYGLKTDFKSNLFEGSKRLIEIADSLTEIKSICECGKKAIINARFIDGIITTTGSVVDIGGDEKYRPLCYSCYKNYINQSKNQ
ncbi:MAG: thymidine kinase [Clostridia bacterium]|nr:thymidine kinase [Clostridia bacterium]